MNIKKAGYILLGLTSTCLGIVGVWVPGLPTTVFILIAMWAFSKSSKRLHRWLMHIPVLRSATREAERFQHEGTVDPRAKFISQGCSWLSFIVVTVVFQDVIISLAVGLLALSCSVFMYLVPSAEMKTTKHVE